MISSCTLMHNMISQSSCMDVSSSCSAYAHANGNSQAYQPSHNIFSVPKLMCHVKQEYLSLFSEHILWVWGSQFSDASGLACKYAHSCTWHYLSLKQNTCLHCPAGTQERCVQVSSRRLKQILLWLPRLHLDFQGKEKASNTKQVLLCDLCQG